MYALRRLKSMDFTCTAKSTAVFEMRIKEAFNMWMGMQKSGSEKTMADFMADKERVRITLEVLPGWPE